MNKNLRKLFSSPVWFLIGAVIFEAGAVRYFIKEDFTGGVIYAIAGILFLLGFIGQKMVNKRYVRR